MKIPGNETNRWAPFISRMDWEVARWAKLRGSGSTAFSDLLAIEGVSRALGLSYRNSLELNQLIDEQLPSRRPSFSRTEVVVGGEAFDLYTRPILDCIRALYGNPEHSQYLCFTPERHYTDANRTMRLYHDLNTGRWWWDTQKALEKDKPGATIIPLIISSDKTQITMFRNKSAYPVYMTIGNLPKEIRRKPSQQGQILLAYLPTSRLEHVSNKSARRRMLSNLFHACMTHVLAPLKEAGLEGIVMQSGDGIRRRCHPILAAYVGDYPEQCLVTTCYQGDCPCCETERNELEEYPERNPYRNFEAALEAAESITLASWVDNCNDVNLKPVQYPFWKTLLYTDIFRSITPDILHQLYQGVMKHLISWLSDICGADEMDARVRRLPSNHNIRIFHKGITSLSRVSGAEHKQMCAFILGTIVDIPHLTPSQSNSLLASTRALLDFLYLANYPVHTDSSLDALDEALASFHSHRDVFIALKVRQNFNLPKLHFLRHYARAIRLFGTTDNYNTETTERLHIDFAKDAYRASNHKDEYAQMTKWLERREKINHHSNYVHWQVNANLLGSPCPSTNACIGERYDFPGAQRTLSDMECVLSQKLTTHPTLKSVSLAKLADSSLAGYGAVDFEVALKRFIVQFRHPALPANLVDEYAAFVVLPFRSLPVWHKIKFVNDELFGKNTLDSISAHPRRFNSDGQVTQTSHFGTALVRVKGNSDDMIEDIAKDTRIARVRTVFSIPEDKLDTLFPPNCPPPKYLAYVEWFTKFGANPERHSGLYRIKKQVSATGTIASSIIPLENILRSAHLLPKWGGAVPAHWSNENVVDQAPSFLLNIFADRHFYYNAT
ncbi:hypothetical protein EV360DRAFT_54847 [Lentinula raphanica]|nr:hypothetical protein EV360DRAFT_54847 [Lentinula raphanica]